MKFLIITIFSCFSLSFGYTEALISENMDINGDLSLPDWGPYTKKYAGVSHITSKEEGIRFDLSVFPAIYKGKVTAPNSQIIADYHPWQSSANLDYYSFRHDLIWKDQVYGDVSYAKISPSARLVTVDCVNNTSRAQSMTVHMLASIDFPTTGPYNIFGHIYPSKVTLPKSRQWIDALDYTSMNYARQGYRNDLSTDGRMRGEVRGHGLVKSSAVRLGVNAGDHLFYSVPSAKKIAKPVLLFRYKAPKSDVSFDSKGVVDGVLTFPKSGKFVTVAITVENPESLELKLVSKGAKGTVEIDGFTLIDASEEEKVGFKQVKWNHKPNVSKGPVATSRILKYENTDKYYGIGWYYPQFLQRSFSGSHVDYNIKLAVKENRAKNMSSNGNGHYLNIYLQPILLKENSTRKIHAVVCTGTKAEVEKQLKELLANPEEKHDVTYAANKKKAYNLDSSPSGKSYELSQQLMSATLMSNTMFPVYTRGKYIRHMAPGKRWPSLYTWDAGFIGLGLLELDVKNAVENLNTYTYPENGQNAFLHHGSPVPVQIYLFKEIWDKTQDKEFLASFYPRLKKYHEFMVGRKHNSNTGNLNSKLVRTWDYFYNSGGWDDYPPQKHVFHNRHLKNNTTPVVSSATCIRCAKILIQAAKALGKDADIKEYQKDIEVLTSSLQTYSWDKESGYFGYVVHDKEKNPKEILRTKTGENFNKGLGGCYPLVSGICTPEQQELLINHLKNPKEIWSKVGLSAVDQSAGYYHNHGYWNGAVWMPHQWFFWKAALDYGEGEFAHKIAKTALETWKNEIDATYNTTEHFHIESGIGNGWHQFGALSSPVLNWYAAYFKTGNVTTGYDAWVTEKKFTDDNSKLEVELEFFNCRDGQSTVLVCMNHKFDYKVIVDGKEQELTPLYPGCYSVSVSRKTSKHTIVITKI